MHVPPLTERFDGLLDLAEEDGPANYSQLCEMCGSVRDITLLEPLAKVPCPVCATDMIISPTIGPYELLKVAGRGGMGVVYKASDQNLGRQVALKVLRKDHTQKADFIAQLEAEAAVTASIAHPHVVKVFTSGTDQGRFYIAMELVDKGTLDDLIKLQGRIAEAQVLDVAIQIADGLRAAHQHGLIHRDVKPGNILFADANHAKIVDFGLAMLEADSEGTNEIWGTPYYVAPEKLDQQPEDFRSDIYSLGATVFHALSGRPPFEAADATTVALKHLKSQVVSLQAFAPHVSNATAYVVNRTLLKDPDQRYQSYDELIEHLQYARTELEQQVSQPKVQKRVVLEDATQQKLWSYAVFGMVALTALAGGGFYFFTKTSTAKETKKNPALAALVVAGANEKQTQAYAVARQQLLGGQQAEAAQAFHALGADAKTAAPLAQWSLAHAGLSRLFAGQPIEARAAFAALKGRPLPESDPAQQKLASFFRTLAPLAADEKAVATAAVKDFDRGTHEAFALVALGMKAWHAGEFDEAAALLRQFRSATPAGEAVWVADYKDLAADYLADLTDYRGAMELLKAAKSPDEKKRAAEALQKLKGQLRRGGALAERIDAGARATATAATDAERRATAQREAEKKAFTEARARAVSLFREWKFSEVRSALAGVSVSATEFQRDKETLVLKADWLAKFKGMLTNDLAANGSSVALRKKEGSAITSTIEGAGAAGLELTGGGTVLWSDLAPESVLALAESFFRADAERRWQAGVYALMSGQTEKGRALLHEAAKARGEYLGLLGMLLPPPKSANLALGKPAVSTSPNKSEGSAQALDGNPKTKWCSEQAAYKWLRVDLGKETTINRWVIKHAGANGEPEELNTVDFELQRSADDKTWTKVEAVWGNTSSVTNRAVTPFTTRWIRIGIPKGSRRANDPAARICEFELYGPADSAAPAAPDFFAPSDIATVGQFLSADIGILAHEPSGSASVDEKGQRFIVRGGGSDVWGMSDGFHFLHRPLAGSAEIVVRIESIQQQDPWSKAGIMLRDGFEATAKNVFLCAAAGGGVALQLRKDAGAISTSSIERGISLPCWLKLVRQDGTFTGFASTDGKGWKQIGTPITASFSEQLHAGLAASSHVTSKLSEVKMEVVQFGTK